MINTRFRLGGRNDTGMNEKEYKYIVGIDEVGRGPIAGPVTVCAFAVATDNTKAVFEYLDGITDSKKLSEKKREIYFQKITELRDQNLVHVAVSSVDAVTIDSHGIVPAITSALNSSLEKLSLDPAETFVYLDGGLQAEGKYINQETVVKGDSKIWQIGAASIVAKVLRDRKMCEYGIQYPEYGFEKHKGYGTKKHRDTIADMGTVPIHRVSWIKT